MSRFDIGNIIKNLKGMFIIALISISFIFLTKYNLNYEVKLNINEISNQKVEKINHIIDANFKKLKYINNHIEDSKQWYKEEYSEDIALKSININSEGYLFEDIGLANKDGYINFGDKKIYIGDRKYFKEALKGKYYISDSILSRYSNEPVVAYSKPFIEDGEVSGVIVGFSNYKQIKTELSSNIYSDKGNVYIIKTNGNVVMGARDNITNIFKDLEFKNSKHEFDISRDLMLGVDYNIFKTSINNEETYYSYKKINSSKGWYLVTSIPIKTVFSGSKNIMMISTFATVIFTIFYILSDTKKYKINKKKLFNVKYIDKITGIENKEKFKEDIQELLKNMKKNISKKYYLITLDIVSFQFMNKNFGYEKGDEVLIGLSNNIKKIEPQEFCARIGNDIFGIVVEKDNNEDELLFIKKIKENILKDFNIDVGHSIDLNIGVTKIDSNDDMNCLLDNAKIARSESKNGFDDNICIYNEDLENKRNKQLIIERDLEHGLKNGDFKLLYQPKVDIKTEKIIGAEALIRWNHQEYGFISPMDFIPIAEKNGYINLIGKWVLERVCIDISESIKHNEKVVPISINISRVELYQSDLIENILNTINKYKIEPKLLEFEITETTALNDFKFINKKINQIKAIGIKISMDDFGTGSSTLSNLKFIDIDILKIDRSIVLDIEEDIKTKALVENIIDIAKKFGFKVVCEGVENMDQVDILRDLKCDIIQGFVYSKPIDIKDLKSKIV